MRKIVKEILEAESRVSTILQEARQKASEIRDSAEREASRKMSDAREKALTIVQTAAEEARKEAERIREERLSLASQQGQALLDARQEVIVDLVDRVCAVILTTDCQTDVR